MNAGDVGPGAVPPTAASTQAAGLTENVAAALCYSLGLITGILFLVLAPYNQNRNIRFHAFQSIFFHVACIIILIGWNIVSLVFGWLLGLISPLLLIGFFVLWLVLIIKAYQGQRLVLPIIGPLAEKQA